MNFEKFDAVTFIEIVSCSDEEVVLKDTRHDGILTIKCVGDIKGEAVRSEIAHSFAYADLLLRIKGSNTFTYKEGGGLSGNVQIYNVDLMDPVLEDANLMDVSLPNSELSVRFASLENVPPYKRPKAITLAYGLYSGADICGTADVNRINNCDVRCW